MAYRYPSVFADRCMARASTELDPPLVPGNGHLGNVDTLKPKDAAEIIPRWARDGGVLFASFETTTLTRKEAGLLFDRWV